MKPKGTYSCTPYRARATVILHSGQANQSSPGISAFRKLLRGPTQRAMHGTTATLALLLGLVSSVCGFQIGSIPIRMARPQLSIVLCTPEVECIVDAENAAEIAACKDADTAPVANIQVEIDEQECIADAESAAEIAACLDSDTASAGVPVAAGVVTGAAKVPVEVDEKECIVDAESAEEIAACYDDDDAAPVAKVEVKVDEQECIVDAESAEEIAACKED